MRLRQLARGQSLLFVASPEVHGNICQVAGKKDDDEIDAYDVVQWALTQSLMHIKKSEPLRIMQGLSYYRRQNAAHQCFEVEPEEGEVMEDTAARLFIEQEEQSLHDLYAPASLKAVGDGGLLHVSRQDKNPEVQALLQRWENIDRTTANSANVQEEHEREVVHEVEQETQIQRPPIVEPLKEIVDDRLLEYIRYGSPEVYNKFRHADAAVVRKS